MIGKIMKNSSFKKTTQYVLGKPGAVMIGGNMAAYDLSGLTREFLTSRDLRPEIKHPVYHISLSLSRDESLNDERFAAIASRYIAGMILSAKEPDLLDDERRFDERLEKFTEEELPCYLHSVFRHTDRQHDHIHIVASRINLQSGEVVSDSFDRYRSQKLIRILEREFDLVRVPSSWEVGERAETIAQLEMTPVTGKRAAIARLQEYIDCALDGSLTLSSAAEKLLERGVSVDLRQLKSGAWGISYGLDGVTVPGYRLGSRYSLNGIKRRGVLVSEWRDREHIRQRLEQVRRLQKLLPSVLNLWRYLNSRRVSFIDGQNYRLLVQRSKQGQDRGMFVIYRKQDEGGNEDGKLYQVLALERNADAVTKESVEFELSRLRIEGRDFEKLSRLFARLSSVYDRISTISTAMRSDAPNAHR